MSPLINLILLTKETIMSIELKIKAKHLALEPGIIRAEEQKLKKQIRYNKGGDTAKLIYKLEDLCHHRRWDVRNESRATHLARTYLAGKPYKSVEIKTDMNFLVQYILPRIHAMVVKYGDRETTKQQIWDWAWSK